jgi:hypothetical protein
MNINRVLKEKNQEHVIRLIVNKRDRIKSTNIRNAKKVLLKVPLKCK